MKKLWNEFKAFINRGSVLDLAVGMIIGSAFTAIITALVNGILKPLINMIPLGSDGQSLQVVLRDPVLAEDGVTVVKEAVIMDFGAVISAIITFLLTALVLFAVIKVINTAKAAAEKEKARLESLVKKDEQAAEAPVEEAAPAVEEAPVTEAPVEANKTEELLTAILEELKSKKAE